MADTQLGTVGCVWGADTITMSGAVVTSSIKTSVDYSKDGDSKKIKDEDGDTGILVFSDETDKLSLEVIPTGASRAAAATCNIVPTRGSPITFTGATKLSQLTGSAWFVLTGSSKLANDGEARVSLTLERYTNNLTTVA